MPKESKKKVNKASSAKQVASSQTAAAPVAPQVVYVTSPAPAVVPFFPSPYPQNVTCPQCHFKVSTSTEYVNGTMVWATCIGLSLIGGLCLACIPFCVDDMKDVQHFCPQCGAFIGEYRRC